MAEFAVTGGTGFIGRHLVLRLVSMGHRVRLLCRSAPPACNVANVQPFLGDVRDVQSLLELIRGADTVVHLAAGTRGDWKDYYSSTVQGTENVLKAARQCRVSRILYASSSGVYRSDGLPSGTIIDEDSALEQALEKRTYYVRAKLLAEQIVLDAMREGDLSIVNLRPALVYGPESAFCTVLYPSVKGKLRIGLGNPSRQVALIHVDDVVEGFTTAWYKAPDSGAIYNLVDDASPSYREYYATYRAIALDGEPILYIPYPFLAPVARAVDLLRGTSADRVGLSHRLKAFCGDVRLTNRKAKAELGWRAAVPFSMGFRMSLEGRALTFSQGMD